MLYFWDKRRGYFSIRSEVVFELEIVFKDWRKGRRGVGRDVGGTRVGS